MVLKKALLFGCLLSGLLIFGCEKKQPTKKVPIKKLRIGSKEDPFSIDPRIAGDRKSQAVLRLLFEGLTRLSLDGIPKPSLAKEITISEDGLIYTFILKDTKWSNGTPITAHDFEYSWKKILSPDYPSHYAYAFTDIQGVPGVKEGLAPLDEVGIKVLSDNTLQVHLRHPAPFFLELLSNPVFYPVSMQHDMENPDWAKTGPYVFNGPFILHQWKFKRCLSLKKNETYWDKKNIHLDKIHISILPDEWTSLLLFENGQLDWVGDPFTSLPYDSIPDLKKRDMLGIAPSSAGFWYVFNIDIHPFTHPKLRKAFAYAIDRKSLVKNILQGCESPAFSILPETMALRSEPIFKDYNIEEARKLFEEALDELGLTRETLPTLTVTGTNKHLLMTQAIKEQWREAFGINVRIQSLEWNVYLHRLRHRDFQIGSLGWESWFNDPIYNLNAQKYKNSKLNHSGWEDSDYINLLDESYQLNEKELRKVCLRKAEDLLMEQMPVVPIYYSNRLYLKKPELSGIFFTPLGNPEFIYCDIELPAESKD